MINAWVSSYKNKPCLQKYHAPKPQKFSFSGLGAWFLGRKHKNKWLKPLKIFGGNQQTHG
jgi:hypothetical protein